MIRLTRTPDGDGRVQTVTFSTDSICGLFDGHESEGCFVCLKYPVMGRTDYLVQESRETVEKMVFYSCTHHGRTITTAPESKDTVTHVYSSVKSDTLYIAHGRKDAERKEIRLTEEESKF